MWIKHGNARLNSCVDLALDFSWRQMQTLPGKGQPNQDRMWDGKTDLIVCVQRSWILWFMTIWENIFAYVFKNDKLWLSSKRWSWHVYCTVRKFSWSSNLISILFHTANKSVQIKEIDPSCIYSAIWKMSYLQGDIIKINQGRKCKCFGDVSK